MAYGFVAFGALFVLAGLALPKLKPIPKIVLVLGGLFLAYTGIGRLGYLPAPQFIKSQQVEKFEVPTAAEEDAPASAAIVPASASVSTAGAVRAPGDVPEIRFRHYAWNSHAGVILANQGKTTRRGSIMQQHGVNLRLIRTDSNDVLMAEVIAFVTELKNGNPQPRNGAHFISMMGDGTAPMLYKLNQRIAKEVGPEYQYKIFASFGRSYGEDKFLGPKKWKDNPQSMRGGVVIGVLQDGDINIVLKYAGDNNVPVNPDPTTYDPDAINFEGAPDNDFLKATQLFVTKPTITRDEVRNGKKTGKKSPPVPIEGVATWTPGDELVVNQLGGVVTIADTKLYSGQMPQAVMGCDKWLKDNRSTVLAFMAAGYEAGQQIKDPRTSSRALADAAKYSSIVYDEKTENDGEYWARMYRGETVQDNQGNTVVLGGSRVFNHADALRLFGIAPAGAANSFKATYTVFGELIARLYPNDLPQIYKWEDVSDDSYLRALQGRVNTTAAEAPVFNKNTAIRQVAGRRVYPINFVFGRADFASGSEQQLEQLKQALLISEDAAVQINGYTDPVGNQEANRTLSDARAEAVANWLRQEASANFSSGRVRSQGFGSTNLLEREPGETTDRWHARCRRVEVVIGS
jgi:OOP family OmpA-OmpF porin